METRFSQRLSMLMKERKISGQRIGDAIGKSQKTISRYANGEVDPSNEIKNMIYRVIADISGIKEDATTEEELDLQKNLERIYAELNEEIQPGCYEWELGIQESERTEEKYWQHERVFHDLSLGAKNYYMENINAFHLVEEWEYCVLDLFHAFTPRQQERFIKYLENFNYHFEELRKNCSANKIAAYTEMVVRSKNRPALLIEKNRNADTWSIEEKKLEEEFSRILDQKKYSDNEEMLGYPEFLSFSPYDWYVLLRITIFELYDSEPHLWSQEQSEVYIGRALDTLLGSIRTGEK